MEGISDLNLKKIGTIAGAISVVIVAFYITGLYKNMLEINKLKKEIIKLEQ